MTTECGICMEPITSQIYKTQCSHSFHNKCLTQWLLQNSSCPLCREEFGPKNIIQEDDTLFIMYMWSHEITPKSIHTRIEKQLMELIQQNYNSNSFMINTNIRIKTSSNKIFNEAALNATNGSKYNPALDEYGNVTYMKNLAVTYEFNL